jgi:tRNA (cytosine49-C5)-methyltransferase
MKTVTVKPKGRKAALDRKYKANKPKPRKGYREARRVKRGRNDNVVEERKFYTKKEVFLSRMASIMQVSPKMARSFFSQRVVSAIRLNPLAGEPDKIKRRLEEHGAELQEVPWSKYTYIVTNLDKSELVEFDEYEDGEFYIQSLSSMLPVIILDPKPRDKILDMTAAPGSKTTQIAGLVDNKAKIYANDNNVNRADKLKNILKAFHVKGVSVTIGEGEKLGEEYPYTFDKVLLDAPCTGEGLIYLQGSNPLRFWHVKKIDRMVEIQKKLILSAYRTLKPGGLLVYSTCTLEPQENEAIVSYLIEQYPDAELENISIDSLPSFVDYKQYVQRGTRKWNKTEFHKFSGRTLRVNPGSVMTGFYIAKIRKPTEV